MWSGVIPPKIQKDIDMHNSFRGRMGYRPFFKGPIFQKGLTGPEPFLGEA